MQDFEELHDDQDKKGRRCHQIIVAVNLPTILQLGK
ncbi:MAG: hypothetical protein ACI8RD_009647 [Bacillariaceae sp.]|jgi:hypothetical protein